jgi:Tfp pilus assembly protein PilE
MDKSVLRKDVNSSSGQSGFTLIFLMVLVVLMMIGALAAVPSVLTYTASRVRAGKEVQAKLDQWGERNVNPAKAPRS